MRIFANLPNVKNLCGITRRLGEVSPTKLYRQVSQVIPDIAEALWNGDADALTATLEKLLAQVPQLERY